MQITIRAKIHHRESYLFLDQMNLQLGHAKRCIFQELNSKKRSLNDIKRDAQIKFGITARQFNSIRIEIGGLLQAYRELVARNEKKLSQRLRKKKEALKVEKDLFKKHHLKRKVKSLGLEIKTLKENKKKASICFGGKKLFRKQFYLKENDYSSHEHWKKDWQEVRNSGFFVVGSKDESFGNQSCQFKSGRLQLRLTNSMEKEFGKKTIDIPIQFTYRENVIEHALKSGQAMNYRFVKEKGSWYVHLTTELKEFTCLTSRSIGALGIDLNPDCIAASEMDCYGNLVHSWQVPIDLRNKRSNQVTQTLGVTISKMVDYALGKKIPIVIEELDFEKKKEQLKSRSYNRMLSGFTYSQFKALIKTQCHRKGVELILVNPAYTSIIGKFKFSEGYGISTHMAAAFAIARRGLGFGERLRTKTQVRSHLPVNRNRCRHVWSDWGLLSQKVAQERILQFQMKKEASRLRRQHRPERTRGSELSLSSVTLINGPP